jgi:hypothetical protein
MVACNNFVCVHVLQIKLRGQVAPHPHRHRFWIVAYPYSTGAMFEVPFQENDFLLGKNSLHPGCKPRCLQSLTYFKIGSIFLQQNN